MEVILRSAKPEDIDEAARICFEAFGAIAAAHNFPSDFPSVDVARRAMEALTGGSGVHAVVAEADGRIVGSNFTHDRRPVASVGPITVDPAAQDRGIGRRLMIDALEWAEARRLASVRLVQVAYHNRSLSLYASLGFDAKEPLSCLQGPMIRKRIPGRSVRRATRADREGCERLCEAIHGFVRGVELAAAIDRGSARVVDREGRIIAYATDTGFSGHAVAERDDDLKALIAAAESFGGPGLLVPTRNGELLRWCLGNGLRIVQPLTLMVRGWYQEPRGPFLPSIGF